jgi:multidrug efflux pump subunit AcrA (membrane-fusion protein)
MVKASIVLAIVLSAAFSASHAQNTRCTYSGGTANCYTNPGITDPYAGQAAAAQQNFFQSQQNQQAQFYANMRALAAERQAREQADEAQAATAQERNAEQQREFRAQNAGRLVAVGKCDEAKTYALSEGDFALANQVATACSSASPIPRP